MIQTGVVLQEPRGGTEGLLDGDCLDNVTVTDAVVVAGWIKLGKHSDVHRTKGRRSTAHASAVEEKRAQAIYQPPRPLENGDDLLRRDTHAIVQLIASIAGKLRHYTVH